MSDPNVLVVIQDESIYRSNEHNNFYWQINRPGEAINTVLRSKGLGSGTMVLAFISIYGFLTLTDAEMNELNAIRAANNLPPIEMAPCVTNQEVDGAFGDADALWFSYHLYKFPGKKLVFLFDWSSGHDKKPADSVILSNMRLKWGGKQPVMRSTTLLQDYSAPNPHTAGLKAGQIQTLVFQPGDEPPFYAPDAVDYIGQPKGAKQVAYERGLWKDGMVLRDDTNTDRSVFHALNSCPDFNLFVKSILQEEIEKLNNLCDFLPNFHCELCPIERVWSKSKRYVRNFSDDTRETLLKNIRKSFWVDNVSLETVARYFRKAYHYACGYRDGDSIVKQMSKQYKSHRAVPPSEAMYSYELAIGLLTCL